MGYEDRYMNLEPQNRSIAHDADAEIASKDAEYAALAKEFEDHMKTHDPVPPPQLDQVGIQIFPERQDLSYWNHETTFDMLAFLGIKNVRGNVGPATSQRTIDFYNKIYDELGIQSCLTVGKPRVVLTNAQWNDIDLTLNAMRGVKRLSGWNEPNHRRSQDHPPTTNWQIFTGDHNHALWERYNTDYLITSMQLWAGNLDTHDTHLDLVAPFVDGTFHEIAWHLYQPGVANVVRFETNYRDAFGDLPIICTETGMSTAPNQRQNAESMTEADQANYLLVHVKQDYVDRGHTVYWFETRDEFDPPDINGEHDRENWLGIFRWDETPKPAAITLKNYLAGV